MTGDRTALPVSVRGSHHDIDAFFTWLCSTGIRWKDARRSETGAGSSAELVIDTLNTHDVDSRVAQWWEESKGECLIHRSVKTATIVGEGIAEQAEVWRVATERLRVLGVVSPSMVGSAWGLTAQVPETRLDDVVRAWHDHLPGLGG